MGCCSSRLPSFPDITVGDSFYPSLETPEGFEKVSLIPQQGTFGSAIGVFFSNDTDGPSYYFDKCKMYKIHKVAEHSPIVSENKEEGSTTQIATIKAGWQSSETEESNENIFDPNTTTTITTAASKIITVVTTVNNVESKVEITKSFDRNLGTGIDHKISEGFRKTIIQSESAYELCQNDLTMAKFYCHNHLGQTDEFQDGINIQKSPVGIYLNSDLTLEAKIQVIAIVAVCDDFLIPQAGLDTTETTTYHDHHHHNQYDNNNHNNYDSNYNDNNDGGGNGWGDGGGDGGGDYGGGGGDY